jgi:hypothetical protein
MCSAGSSSIGLAVRAGEDGPGDALAGRFDAAAEDVCVERDVGPTGGRVLSVGLTGPVGEEGWATSVDEALAAGKEEGTAGGRAATVFGVVAALAGGELSRILGCSQARPT